MSAPAASPSMPPQKILPKVLRIGVVQDGKIVQERLIRTGETVTVGDSPRNTFVITGTKLPQRHDLFVAKHDGTYYLTVPDWVEGKISWKDGIRGLDELRTRGEAVKKGEAYHVTLTENVRGKVTIGPSTFLFQFVPAPPEPVRQVTAADFRPKLFDDDDPLFSGLLGVFTLVAASFMVWVYVTPLPERADLDVLADAVDLVVDKPIQIQMQDPNQVVGEGPKEEKKVEKAEAKAETKAADADAGQDKPKAPDAESVKKKSLLLQVIGTAGNASGDNAVADLLGDDSAGMAGLDKALAGVSGVQEATAANVGSVKGGSGGGREDAKVGVGVMTGGTAGTGGGAAVQVKAKIVTQNTVDADVTEGDAGGIASVVKKSQGRIQTCVEQGLKANPNMNGRVSVGWTVTGGRVTEAHLVSNSTGDSALGQCIVKAVRQFRFDSSLSAEVAEFPWVVSGQ